MQQRAADIAKILGGKPEGAGYLCRCPVRSHGKGRGDLRPSLGVSDGDRGLIVHCFAGCDPREVLAALRKLAPDASPLRAPATPAGGVPPRRAVKTTTDLALRLWRAAIDVAGTPAETYLRSRSLPASPPKTIRFLRSYRYDETRRFPCLVAAVQAPSRKSSPSNSPSSIIPAVAKPRSNTRAAPLARSATLCCASRRPPNISASPKDSKPHGPHRFSKTALPYGRRSAPIALASLRSRRPCAASPSMPITTPRAFPTRSPSSRVIPNSTFG